MRVAFSVFGGDGWTGGINYLRNLLSAVAELPNQPVQAVLFIAPETSIKSIEMLLPYLAQPPVVVPGWAGGFLLRLKRLAGSALLQRDFVSEAAFKQEKIDVVFQHAAWYGLNFPIPTLAWIADFQHKHLPHMFSKTNILKRDLGYWALSYCATRVMLSSEDARADCERFFPRFKCRTSVLPFCVQVSEQALTINPEEIRRHYQLPVRYFYLPNQFWRHKNHIGIIEALKILKAHSERVVIVLTGNPKDGRNLDYPAKIIGLVEEYGLQDSFRFLGMVPFEHIMPLMRGSLAVINPSLFEGWSTPVEEAKALGVPMLLSNLDVHREQAEGVAQFFDPHNLVEIADDIKTAWHTLTLEDRPVKEFQAISNYRKKRLTFGENFAAILSLTVRK